MGSIPIWSNHPVLKEDNMYHVSLDFHVYLHTTPSLAAARRIQKRIRKCGFWFRKEPGYMFCSYKKFAGAKHFTEFFQEDIIIQNSENS
jgi:hypothetical protein